MKKLINSNSIVTVAYIHIVDKRLLLCRAKKHKGFYMPGGKHEEGESDKETLIREVKEEIDVDLIPSSLKYYGTFEAQAYAKPKGVMVRIICYVAEHKGDIKASAEIGELKFFTMSEYLQMEETAPAVLLILKDLKEKGRID